jgi:hypothetical protein
MVILTCPFILNARISLRRLNLIRTAGLFIFLSMAVLSLTIIMLLKNLWVYKSTYLDLQTLEGNLEAGMYTDKLKFVKDVGLIFSNAKSYNKPNTIYHKYAKDLETMIEEDIKSLRDR